MKSCSTISAFKQVLLPACFVLSAALTDASTPESAPEHRDATAAQVQFGCNQDELRQLRAQIEALQKAQTGLSNEVRQLKALIRGKDTAAPVEATESFITIFDPATVLGDPSAPVTLVEFGDFDCTFCRKHFQETLPQIKQELIDTGKIRYVFCNFPMSSVHPKAFLAAEAAHCASEQGQFWPMHDWLLRNSTELDEDSLGFQAEALGMDAARFRECLASRKHSTLVQEEMSEAIKAGIKGTPTFFLGITEPNARKIKVQRMIKGAPPFRFFKQNIDDLLGR